MDAHQSDEAIPKLSLASGGSGTTRSQPGPKVVSSQMSVHTDVTQDLTNRAEQIDNMASGSAQIVNPGVGNQDLTTPTKQSETVVDDPTEAMPPKTSLQASTSDNGQMEGKAQPENSNVARFFDETFGNRYSTSRIQAFDNAINAPRPLFVYGTLMLPMILANVLCPSDLYQGRTDDIMLCASQLADVMIPAKLHGRYARLCIKDTDIPALVDDRIEKTTICGMVIFNLSFAAQGRIDRYEGLNYVREAVEIEVTCLEGHELIIEADTYFFVQGIHHLHTADEKTWDLASFVRSFTPREETESAGLLRQITDANGGGYLNLLKISDEDLAKWHEAMAIRQEERQAAGTWRTGI